MMIKNSYIIFLKVYYIDLKNGTSRFARVRYYAVNAIKLTSFEYKSFGTVHCGLSLSVKADDPRKDESRRSFVSSRRSFVQSRLSFVQSRLSFEPNRTIYGSKAFPKSRRSRLKQTISRVVEIHVGSSDFIYKINKKKSALTKIVSF